MSTRSLLIFLLLYVSTASLKAQTLDRITKETAISELIAVIREEYIIEENIPAMVAFLEAQLKKGAYDSLPDTMEFTMAVTDDLKSVGHDKHLGFVYRKENKEITDSIAEQQKLYETMRAKNFGFAKVEHLPGNIGYVKFNDFWPLAKTQTTIDAAMNFVAYSDHIIIDLRDNGGGDPETVAYLCSYFVKEQGTLINTMQERKKKQAEEWRTTLVNGKKMVTQPVYILTSNYTFSAAEEFAYDLQCLKRATIAGEITGGGAHPVNGYPLSNHFVARIPYAKAINPYTKTNWERIGVIPEIKVSAQDALTAALNEIKDHATDAEAKRKLSILVKAKNAEAHPVCLDNALLVKYAGRYGIRTVTLDNRTLFIQRDGGPKFRLIPLTDKEFSYDGSGAVAVFNNDDNEMEITMENGTRVKVKKN